MRSVRYSPTVLSNAGVTSASVPEGDGATPPDDYQAKIAKYVPAEVLAFVIPVSTQVESDEWRWATVGAAVLGTALLNYARKEPTTWYFHLLAVIALLVWLIGGTNFGDELLSLSAKSSALVLGFTVFLIPAIDAAVTKAYE